MTAYAAIANGDIDQDSPVTQPLMTALRDNPIATAEGSVDAPITAAGWHPYDAINIGDGNDGKIYDFATDGSVANLVSPDFADGYEYRFVIVDISGATSSADFRVEMYRETTAGYDTATAIFSMGVTASVGYTGMITIPHPRLSRKSFLAERTTFVDDSAGGTASGGAATVSHGATAEKILRFRFSWSAGNIDGGVIYMLRRRDPLTV